MIRPARNAPSASDIPNADVTYAAPNPMNTTDSVKIDQWRKQLMQPEAQENIFEAATRAFSGRTRPRSHYFPITGPALPQTAPSLPKPVKTDDDGVAEPGFNIGDRTVSLRNVEVPIDVSITAPDGQVYTAKTSYTARCPK